MNRRMKSTHYTSVFFFYVVSIDNKRRLIVAGCLETIRG